MSPGKWSFPPVMEKKVVFVSDKENSRWLKNTNETFDLFRSRVFVSTGTIHTELWISMGNDVNVICKT